MQVEGKGSSLEEQLAFDLERQYKDTASMFESLCRGVAILSGVLSSKAFSIIPSRRRSEAPRYGSRIRKAFWPILPPCGLRTGLRCRKVRQEYRHRLETRYEWTEALHRKQLTNISRSYHGSSTSSFSKVSKTPRIGSKGIQ